MACNISGFITITVTFSVITACSKSYSRTITHFNGYPSIKTTRFISAAFLMVLFCCFDVYLIICHQSRALFTRNIRTFNINIRILSGTCRHNIYFAASINLGFIGCFSFSMRVRFALLLAISDLYTDQGIDIPFTIHKIFDIGYSLFSRLVGTISLKASISCRHSIHSVMFTITNLFSGFDSPLYCLNGRNNRGGNSNS